MKKVVTITGIRPDFIRMSEIFKRLDAEFEHILIHTGQHYDSMLSDVFFDELNIRKPDYNLKVGGIGIEHFQQSAEVSIKVIKLLRKENIKPDIIMFLGDSNSVVCAVPLKKEGYIIGHIEAGMRSGDRRMLEETNRTVCDHCSDELFVYHPDYARNLIRENIMDGVHVVGNTIVEVCKPFANELFKTKKAFKGILLDIHRPENFKYPDRLRWIISFANECGKSFIEPVKMLAFKRTMDYMEEFRIGLGNIEMVPLMSYKQYLETVYHSMFIISDSGTAQEEPALLGTSVIVPRDYTERPQSMSADCSFMVNPQNCGDAIHWADDHINGLRNMDVSWLGDGNTSERIINLLKERL